MNPRNFKILVSNLNLPFLRKNQEIDAQFDGYSEFPGLNELTLYMIFAIFVNMVISMMDIFLENFQNHIKGTLVKIQEFTQVMIFLIFLEKLQFRPKMKV